MNTEEQLALIAEQMQDALRDSLQDLLFNKDSLTVEYSLIQMDYVFMMQIGDNWRWQSPDYLIVDRSPDQVDIPDLIKYFDMSYRNWQFDQWRKSFDALSNEGLIMMALVRLLLNLTDMENTFSNQQALVHTMMERVNQSADE